MSKLLCVFYRVVLVGFLVTWTSPLSQEIIKIAEVSNSSSFQQLDKEKQRGALRMPLDVGASVRQLQRLTGLGRGFIQSAYKW